MSEINENITINNSVLKSFVEPRKEFNKDDNLQELKTTHSGWVCINYNSEYLRERLFKLKEESTSLRQKMISLENENLKEKNNLEKIILTLREEKHFLKQNYEMQKINIDNLNKDKQNLLNQLKEIQNINNNLVKDREILIEQIKDLNNIINNNISPKLKINEKDLIFLQNKINELQKTIMSLENEKIKLNNDNIKNINMIKVLSTQNKKLLNEIKMKYNKDLSFIESIEKIGVGKNINLNIYKEMTNKYRNNKNNNQNKNKNKKNKIMNFTYDKEIFCINEDNDIKSNRTKNLFALRPEKNSFTNEKFNSNLSDDLEDKL